MSAYVVIHASVKDADKFKEYGAAAGPIVKAHNGELVTAGHLKSVLHGDEARDRCVIIRFDDAAAAEGWYNSPEYQAVIPIRNEALDSVFMVIE
jgi:uncharacterized protein (DUF1330 family)